MPEALTSPVAHLREDGIAFGAGKVVGDPVRDAMRFAPEDFGVHVAEWTPAASVCWHV